MGGGGVNKASSVWSFLLGIIVSVFTCLNCSSSRLLVSIGNTGDRCLVALFAVQTGLKSC